MTGTADESGFADFLAAAADGRQTLLGDARDLDAIERADGEAFCAQVIETALQLVVVDPARPAFVPWQTPTRRYTDNGLDSVYGLAFVSPPRVPPPLWVSKSPTRWVMRVAGRPIRWLAAVPSTRSTHRVRLRWVVTKRW